MLTNSDEVKHSRARKKNGELDVTPFEMRYHARRLLSARAQLPDRRETLTEIEPRNCTSAICRVSSATPDGNRR